MSANSQRENYWALLNPGIDDLQSAELESLSANFRKLDWASREDELSFEAVLLASQVSDLRTVHDLFACIRFEVPRPKALLSDENIKQLSAFLSRHAAKYSLKSFRFETSNSKNQVSQRIAEELSSRSGVLHLPADGELLLRLVKVREAWFILARCGQYPLSKRAWRVANMPGALSGHIAAAIVDLARKGRQLGVLLDPCAGSGSIGIEAQLSASPVEQCISVEVDSAALEKLKQNDSGSSLKLVQADFNQLPLPADSIDTVIANLPWGERKGSRADNLRLYRSFLSEMQLALRQDGLLMALTQDYGAFKEALKRDGSWRLSEERKIYQGGYHPRLFTLKPRSPQSQAT